MARKFVKSLFSRIKLNLADLSGTICSCFSCSSIWDEHSCTFTSLSKSLIFLEFKSSVFFGHLSVLFFYHFLLKNLKNFKEFCKKSLNLLDFVEQRFCRQLLSMRQEWFTREATLCFTTQQITNNVLICFFDILCFKTQQITNNISICFFYVLCLQLNKLQTIF